MENEVKSSRELLKQAFIEADIETFDKIDASDYVPSERMIRFGEALKSFERDVTGAILLPGYPEKCEGNGEHPDYECCCDECDHYLKCFPDAMPQ